MCGQVGRSLVLSEPGSMGSLGLVGSLVSFLNNIGTLKFAYYFMSYRQRHISPVPKIPLSQVQTKIRHYCAYQERSHTEVKEKLYSLGLRKPEVEELLSQLIEEDYLNEERFAIQFAGGKFRMKHWGRVKIKYELKQRQVSEYCIRKAMKEIDENDYQRTLQKLAEEKWQSIRGEGVNRFVKMGKTTDYLLQKGFEPELVRQTITALKNGSAEK